MKHNGDDSPQIVELL